MNLILRFSIGFFLGGVAMLLIMRMYGLNVTDCDNSYTPENRPALTAKRGD